MNRAKLTLLALPIVAVVALVAGVGGWVGGQAVISSQDEEKRQEAQAAYKALPVCTEPATSVAAARACLANVEMMLRDIGNRPASKAETLRQVGAMRQQIQFARAYPGDTGRPPSDTEALVAKIDAAEAAAKP